MTSEFLRVQIKDAEQRHAEALLTVQELDDELTPLAARKELIDKQYHQLTHVITFARKAALAAEESVLALKAIQENPEMGLDRATGDYVPKTAY